MIVRRIFACVALSLGLAIGPAVVQAKPTLDVRADRLSFFADLSGIIARDRIHIHTAGLDLRGTSAYLDLHANRLIVAGDASATRGTRTLRADAIALDLTASRIDVLYATSGAERSTFDLAQTTPEVIEPDRFAFPDLDERRAYIRAKHASITPNANARFSPASFPNSPGAFPVPSYLFTFSTNPSFGTSAFGGATFDQPYGISGGTTSLLAAHFRYEDGIGPTFGFDDHHVYGDNAYIVTAVDSPMRPMRSLQFSAYQKMGSRFSQTLDAAGTNGFVFAHYGLSAALRSGSGARFDASRANTFTSLGVSTHTGDRPLVGAITSRLEATFGVDMSPAGVLSVLPDRLNYRSLWHHGLDVSLNAPSVAGPLGTSLSENVTLSRTWYAFPHQFDQAVGSLSVARTLLRNVRLFATYSTAYSYDIYPTAQGLFYPRPGTPFVAPDGTPYPGYAAFTGATTQRGLNLSLTYSKADTNLRLSLAQADDFPQFHGYGRAPLSVRLDGRIRPLPNIGLAFGRSYAFGFGGQRFSRLTFSVLP